MSVIVDEENRSADDSGGAEPLHFAEPSPGAGAPQPPTEPAEPRYRIPLPLQLTVMLLAGLAVGGYFMHRHDRAKIPVAVVNGYVVNKTALDNALEQAAGPATVSGLIKDELGVQFAKKMGVMPTQDEVHRRYQELLAKPGAADLLASTGQTEADVERQLLLQLSIVNVTRLGVDITPADVKRYYEHNIDPNNPSAQYYTPPAVDLSVIETKSHADIVKAEEALQRQQAFADVAFKYSQDPTRLHGGRIPGEIFKGRSAMSKVPGLESAIFGMTVGEVYGPAFFAGDWWIIQCNDRTAAIVLPFDMVKDDCEDGAVLSAPQTARSRAIKAEFDEFVRKSNIRAFDSRYDSAVKIAP